MGLFIVPSAFRMTSLLGGLALLSMASCGRGSATDGDRQLVFPVSGEVLVRGQRADNALVILHPSTSDSSDTLRPTGRTDSDGKFNLSTYESGDGAPAGEYVVTIVWPERPSGPMPDSDLARDRLRGRYANPLTSTLRAEVEERENVLPPFALK